MKKIRRLKIVIIVLIFILLTITGVYFYKSFTSGSKELEKVSKNSISEYGYTLYEGMNSLYEPLFLELHTLLTSDEINETKYAKLIGQMFVIDFYSLKDKTNNTDIGGLDFVSSDIIDNFKLKAENTIYKYAGHKKIELPNVSKIDSVVVEEKDNFYLVKIKWEYETDLEYETEKELKFVKNNNKLILTEMS